MKKILNLMSVMLICAIAFMAVACGDDNDEPDAIVTDASLIGKWEPVGNDLEFTYVEFLSNHTGAFHFVGDEPHEFTWALKGNALTIEHVYNGHVYERFEGRVVITGDIATIDGTSTSYELDGETWHETYIVKKMK